MASIALNRIRGINYLSFINLAYGTFFTRAMFLSALAGEKSTPNFFQQKQPK